MPVMAYAEGGPQFMPATTATGLRRARLWLQRGRCPVRVLRQPRLCEPAYGWLHRTGGAAALTGTSGNIDATFTTLGLRASVTFDLGDATLTAKSMLGWRHAISDAVPLSDMRFAGGSAFSIAGVPTAHDTAVVEAGLDYTITPNATFGLSYGGQFGSGMSDQSVKAGFSLKF